MLSRLRVAAPVIASASAALVAHRDDRCARLESGLSPSEWRPLTVLSIDKLSPNTSKFRFLLPDESTTAGLPVASCLLTKAPLGAEKPDGTRKPDYQPGLELHARYTLFGEGVRGHLSKQIQRQFNLCEGVEPQIYGLGVKELWDIDPALHQPGKVIHTQGWPLSESDTNGGGWIYHQANGQVSLGLVTWLNYSNPYVFPFAEMQRWKTHPEIAALLKVTDDFGRNMEANVEECIRVLWA